jgi:hypothetical protein
MQSGISLSKNGWTWFGDSPARGSMVDPFSRTECVGNREMAEGGGGQRVGEKASDDWGGPVAALEGSDFALRLPARSHLQILIRQDEGACGCSYPIWNLEKLPTRRGTRSSTAAKSPQPRKSRQAVNAVNNFFS